MTITRIYFRSVHNNIKNKNIVIYVNEIQTKHREDYKKTHTEESDINIEIFILAAYKPSKIQNSEICFHLRCNTHNEHDKIMKGTTEIGIRS